jgi:hypothetical protein
MERKAGGKAAGRKRAINQLYFIPAFGKMAHASGIKGLNRRQRERGGVLYVVFWSLLFSLLLPETKPRRIALSVFMATCTIETLQRRHPPFLEAIRVNFVGATLLGSNLHGSICFTTASGSSHREPCSIS